MSSGSKLRVATVIYSLTAIAVIVATGVGASWYRPRRQVTHLYVPPVDEQRVEPARADVLRVCADPNDLPYSNGRGEGYENAIAQLVAADLHRTLRYAWQPQRRGFIRTTLGAGACDVVMAVPEHFEPALTTKPYYRSTYVFVARRDTPARVRSLDDRALRTMRIGVQVVGEDYENPPAVQALAVRGLADHVRGYTVYGNYADEAPQRALIDGVAHGEVDIALAWGPLAGYFAGRSAVPLELTSVPDVHDATTPFTFGISMGVRRGNQELARQLDSTITRRGGEIRRILERFGVPLVS